jgi:hypothetical protein
MFGKKSRLERLQVLFFDAFVFLGVTLFLIILWEVDGASWKYGPAVAVLLTTTHSANWLSRRTLSWLGAEGSDRS